MRFVLCCRGCNVGGLLPQYILHLMQLKTVCKLQMCETLQLKIRNSGCFCINMKIIWNFAVLQLTIKHSSFYSRILIKNVLLDSLFMLSSFCSALCVCVYFSGHHQRSPFSVETNVFLLDSLFMLQLKK